MKVIGILGLTPNQRAEAYRAVGIDRVIIDGNEFTDYKAFSFLWEKSYVKSPVRSGDGTIGNLNSYATFLTPHLKIDFSMMSIDSYRTLMKLLYSKNEFTVTCYDVVYDETTTNKMYFSTEEMPKLWTMVEALNGNEEAIELLGVQDYVVEMVGTNSEVEVASITYNLNVPSGVSWIDAKTKTEEIPINLGLPVGDSAILEVTQSDGKKVSTRISAITFGDKYKFKHWCENANDTGFKYIDEDVYMFRKDTTLYAIWGASAE